MPSILLMWYNPASQLFWYRPIFMAELLCAEALFCLKLKRKPYFLLRLGLMVLLCLRVSFLIPIVSYSALYNAFMFFAMFAVTIPLMKFCFEESWKGIFFCAFAGYGVQHIAFQLYDIVGLLFYFDPSASIYLSSGTLTFLQNAKTFTAFLGCHFFAYFAIYLIFGRRMRKNMAIDLQNLTLLTVVIFISLFNIVLSSVVTYTCYDPYNRNALIMLAVNNVFCSCLLMYIQFKLLRVRDLEHDLDMEKRLRREEEQQYVLSQETVRLINLKCHDLKHQIRAIGQNVLDSEVLAEIADAVSIYDATFKTGNEALDIILTEKSLRCRAQGIRLTCVTNAVPLLFMKDPDVYSLFGNAIDNAMRAVEHLESDKQVISISIKQHGSMVSVNVSNWYEGELVFENGLPRTTGEPNGYHGFGMVSMREIVERYAGEFSVSAEGGVFHVDILFPDVQGASAVEENAAKRAPAGKRETRA